MNCHLRRLLVLTALLAGCQSSLTVAGSDGGGRRGDGALADGGTEDPIDGGESDLDADTVTPLDDGGFPIETDAGDEDEVLPPMVIDEPPDPPEELPPDPPDMPDVEPDTGARAVQATYRVLHWNIAGGKVNDCRTAGITAAVRRIVNEHDIDFVGLNEVCPEQFEAIREALRDHWGKGPGANFAAYVGDGSPRIVGNAIFSRFNIEDVVRIRVGEDRYGDRNLLCGRVPARTHLRFCSTHLTPGDAAARSQLRTVHSRAEQWFLERNDTVILTGDFNLMPNDPAFDAVYAEQANHPRNNPGNRGRYHELDDNDADHCMGYGERSHPGTGGPCGEGGKIDFIFVRRSRIVDGRDYNADSLTIPTTCGGSCSDHRPIRGRVRVLVRED